MFDIREYYAKENAEVEGKYLATLEAIKEINKETELIPRSDSIEKYYQFFHATSKFIMKLVDFEKNLNEDYFSKKDFDELWKDNNDFYDELKSSNYSSSYADPVYCVNVFGDNFGPLISFFYLSFRKYIKYAFYHKSFRMVEYNQLFIDVFERVRSHQIDYQDLKSLITSVDRLIKTKDFAQSLNERFNKDFRYLRDIVECGNLSDLRYLFRYGNYITDSEIKTAKYLLGYPETKLRKLSNQISKAYLNGFVKGRKDLSRKSTTAVHFDIGYEPIVCELIQDLEKSHLQTLIPAVYSTRVNRQFDYDHRFDSALYLDKEYVDSMGRHYLEACEISQGLLRTYSGLIDLREFGEPPFKPVNKKECLRFTEEQQTLYQENQSNIMHIHERFAPQRESSFTIIAFPSPKIGDKFELIFDDIYEVNMLDPDKYEPIQQKIIEVLDRAEYVHIKGNNKTDIRVKMHELNHPDKETNFHNCGADVNIPVGEVYTSPQLTGTDGVLHVSEAFLDGLKFVDLMLVFKDGYITDYNCRNFENPDENRKYIEENLLFPHKTLPLGEFAIGTNTLAYKIAKKHNVMHVLPILIIEKIGPHFAIGDTCFMFDEDTPVYNFLDNKEMIARDNEKSALRKTDMAKAYTYRHTDITLPYDEIDFISAITKSGTRIDILKNGRFVLEGTEELNKPLG